MIDIKVLRAMAAAGATVEMILAAVEAAQAQHDTKVSVRREKDAARQHRNRQKRRSSVTRSHAESQAVTRSHGLSRGPSDDVCDIPGIYTSPSLEEVSKEGREEYMPAKRKRPLPEGFTLTAALSSSAEKLGWGRARIQSEFNRFCDHARANGRKQIDWDAAWRNWVSSPFQKPDQPNGQPKKSVSDVLIEMCEASSRAARENHDGLLSQNGCSGPGDLWAGLGPCPYDLSGGYSDRSDGTD